MDTLLTVEGLGRLLSTSPKTLYKAINSGRLPAIRVAGIRLNPSDVVTWLRERSTKHKETPPASSQRGSLV